MNFSKIFKPRVKKRTLLFVAGLAWTTAGYGLFLRAIEIVSLKVDHPLYYNFAIGLVGGIAFYLILFRRLSGKAIRRIGAMTEEKPCLFSFFSLRSYIMMVVMISGGITLRKLDLFNIEYFYTFYFIMSVPLFISAFRFFREWYRNNV